MAASEQRPLDQALQRLYTRNLHVIKLGLDAMRALARELGEPQSAYPCVHIAGTNGKGSVSAILASIFRAAGYRTALYTSPHLVRFHERIQINGEPIRDEELAEGIDAVEAAAARVRARGERDVTFFEFTTALAFRHFQRAGVEIAVIETGMGGRLDATNIVDPLISAITSIGFDHQKWLGDTLEKIATEKAGIIKPRRPVVIGDLPEEGDAVMRNTARDRGAPLVRASEACRVQRIKQEISSQHIRVETASGLAVSARCPLIGRHQLANLSIAIATAELAFELLDRELTTTILRQGLETVAWPARAQLIDRDPPTLLDGAHNPQAMEALSRTVDEVRGERPVCLMASFLADKDATECLALFRRTASHLVLVALDDARAMSPADLLAAAERAGWRTVKPPAPLREAWDQARAWCRANRALLVIAGSLHLAGAVLATHQHAR